MLLVDFFCCSKFLLLLFLLDKLWGKNYIGSRAETDFKPELKMTGLWNTCEMKFGGMKPVN